MEPAYNQRLFRKGLRKRWHLARFLWLSHRLQQDFGADLAGMSVVELGCFDAKTLDFLPIRPLRYTGYDAGWGGGLEHAQARFSGDPTVKLGRCSSPQDVEGSFDLAIYLENLEHLPLAQLEAFVARLAEAAPRLYASVPVEWGPVFLLKHLYKAVTRNRPDPYTMGETLAATLGMTGSVERIEGAHKGFDYRDLVEVVRRHYPHVRTFNLHLPGLPLFLSGGVGVVASRG
jgi:hypothetical protein